MRRPFVFYYLYADGGGGKLESWVHWGMNGSAEICKMSSGQGQGKQGGIDGSDSSEWKVFPFMSE